MQNFYKMQAEATFLGAYPLPLEIEIWIGYSEEDAQFDFPRTIIEL